MERIFKYVSLFTAFVAGGLGGLLVSTYFTGRIFSGRSAVIPNGSDVISVANTYIVFITFIFVVITIFITGIGLYFTKWFGITKDREIRESMMEFFQKIDSDEKFAISFVKMLLENKIVSTNIQKIIAERVASERQHFANEEDEEPAGTINLTEFLKRDGAHG
jgi:hypothetical protein